MDNISIRYEADTGRQFDENLIKAETDYSRLLSEGYLEVRIVVSNNWASEGIWVEAADKLPDNLSKEDKVYKSNQKPV